MAEPQRKPLIACAACGRDAWWLRQSVGPAAWREASGAVLEVDE